MLERGEKPVPLVQAETGVTYAHKISKSEAVLDFDLSAIELDRRIRAFDPAPGAVAMLGEIAIKVWGARPGPREARSLPPGTVRGFEDGGLGLACDHDGRDTLVVEELQKPGGKRLAVAQFLPGFPLSAGERFGSSGEPA
jgi:methionyl-tRNA formyltransferase